jgi:hypothetical protein
LQTVSLSAAQKNITSPTSKCVLSTISAKSASEKNLFKGHFNPSSFI